MESEIITAEYKLTWRFKLNEVVHDREHLMICEVKLERSLNSGQAMPCSVRTSSAVCVDSDSGEEFVRTVVSPSRFVVMGPVESSQGDPCIM